MGKPNRKRRNGRLADRFKHFKVRRKNTEKPDEDSPEMETLVEKRTNAFLKIFDRMEREQISENEAKIIARFATKDGIISYAGNQDIDRLEDIQVEELTEFEFNSIITRATRGVNVILENRFVYREGPFFVNRGMRQAAIAKNRRVRKIKLNKPTTAGGIFKAMAAKKAAKKVLGI